MSRFVQIATLLNQRLKKNQSAIITPLNSDELLAMISLKNSLKPLAILATFYFGGNLTIDTDSYHVQTCCICLQKQLDDTVKTSQQLVPFFHWCRKNITERSAKAARWYESSPLTVIRKRSSAQQTFGPWFTEMNSHISKLHRSTRLMAALDVRIRL